MPPAAGRSVQTSPPVMSRAFMDRAFRIQPSPDPDTATQQTVELMAALIQRSANDPVLKRCVATALKQYSRGGPVWALRGIDPFQAGAQLRRQAACEAIWWYCKHQVKFVHHSKQIDVWLGERDQLQLLIEPAVLVRFPFRMEGDCAIFTMLISAMLECLGIPYEIVTAAVNPQEPSIFSHVWPRSILPDGSRMPLDASHGKFPGWSVPLSHRFRVQVWDADGSPISDAGELRFSGLHGYRVRGLGDDNVVSDTGGTIDPSAGNTSISLSPIYTTAPAGGSLDLGSVFGSQFGLSTSTDPVTGLAVTNVGGSQGYVAPSVNSTQWAAFATALAKGGMTLAQINAIQPGTVVSANGAILRQSTGFAVPGTTGASLSSLSSISPTYLMFGGLA